MKRFLSLTLFLVFATAGVQAQLVDQTVSQNLLKPFKSDKQPMAERVEKTEDEWKDILTKKEFKILRKKGTELPYTNEYNSNKRDGVYKCAGCGTELFTSTTKYDSGSGWPSFYAPMKNEHISYEEDTSLFMKRTEVLCAVCDGHLGHVFDDGPQPTGLRYCLNSAALDFDEKEVASEDS